MSNSNDLGLLKEKLEVIIQLQLKQISLLEKIAVTLETTRRRRPVWMNKSETSCFVIDTLKGLVDQMTQKQIAEHLDVTNASVSHYINGKYLPNKVVLERLRIMAATYLNKTS